MGFAVNHLQLLFIKYVSSLLTEILSFLVYGVIFTLLDSTQGGIGDRKAVHPSVRPSNA